MQDLTQMDNPLATKDSGRRSLPIAGCRARGDACEIDQVHMQSGPDATGAEAELTVPGT